MERSLAVRIAQHYWSFWERVRLLDSFVTESSSHYGTEALQAERLRDKLRRWRAGEVVEPEPDPAVSVELSEQELELLVEVLTYRLQSLTAYPKMTHEMALIYLVALFDAFTVDCLSSVLAERPEMLRSSKQITYERALEFEDRAALIAHLIEREMIDVGYKSVADQAEYIHQKLNIRLEESGVTIAELTELHARRNLLVHSRGVVNSVYIAATRNNVTRVGDRLTVDDAYLKRALDALDMVATLCVSGTEGEVSPT
jgi:hypothetical protein